MHIKHYHPEYSRFMGATPNVADLAYARTVGEEPDGGRPIDAAFFEQIERFEEALRKRAAPVREVAATTVPTVPLPSPVAEEPVKSPQPPAPAAAPSPAPAELPPTVEVTFNPDKPIDFEDYIKPVAAIPTLPPPPPPSLATPREFTPPPAVVTGIKTLLPVIRGTPKVPPLVLLEEDEVTTGEAMPAAVCSPAEVRPPPASEPALLARSESTTPLAKSKAVKKRRLSDMYIETLKKRRLGKLTKCNDDSALSGIGGGVSPVSPHFPNQQPQQKYRYLKKKKISSPSPQTVATPSILPETSMDTSEPDGSPMSVAPPLTEEETFEQLQKRDIINCTCGIMEEDGLMIQCDLCLCWQHVLCNNSMEEVPDKYVCFICLNPARERKSSRYLHDQYWLKDGVLPSLSFRTKDEAVVAAREARLGASHELTGDLLGYKEVLHSLRVKLAIVQQTDHPKLYLWSEKPVTAAPAETAEVKLEAKTEGEGEDATPRSQDQSKSPAAVQDHTYVHLDKTTPAAQAEQDKVAPSADESLKLDSHILAQALTSGFGPSTVDPVSEELIADAAAAQSQLLTFPICRSELMRFANSMADNLKDTAIEPAPLPSEPPPPQAPAPQAPPQAPQPEKPIDPLECRINLLDHIEDFQDQLDARLALIEQQVTALEAEDPEPPSEETISFYPQTKHTLQMLNRDLGTMKKLATVATGYTVVKW